MPDLNDENYTAQDQPEGGMADDEFIDPEEAMKLVNGMEQKLQESKGEQETDAMSQSEIDRLSGMKLDNILQDVNEQLNADKQLTGEQSEPAADIKAEEPEKELEEFLSGRNPEEDGKKKKKKKDKKKKKEKAPKEGKKKKKKKGLLGAVGNIFFESLDKTEELPEGLDAGTLPDAGGGEQPEKAGGEQAKDVRPSADGSEAPLDENEKILQEMYGELEEGKTLDENVAPQKGFFAKLRYRFDQMKKKNEEEDKAEQEAEELEAEEKRKRKAEKQEEAKIKKENAKKEKAEKPKKEKKPKPEKPKKEKKPKPEPKPGDILKIRPLSILKFILFVTGVIVLIVVLNNTVYYRKSADDAREYMENGSYEKAYDALSGVKRSKNDETMYKQASVISYVGRQYDSYQNYMKIGRYTEAINALIKGLDRYDMYYSKAQDLGVEEHVDEIRSNIIDAFLTEFKISEEEAESLVDLSKSSFTQYYFKIEAYGKARGGN